MAARWRGSIPRVERNSTARLPMACRSRLQGRQTRRLLAFTQLRTENRYTLFLELLSFVFTQFRTENRYTLFLELL
ncbi:conserved hypothetical protein [Mesorhizobium metallidurans STM 2683]|uniref:Uncharacterized protein n=1 Tax=Mesorhizobium metallidurans STM 2683 TaxID=1297569 RepID=M5EJN6_9HYPH|nr:conserved hypothetical protein [Mesorhizobium metallidurans STM 2683]